jgi:hypothetical protein
MLGEAQFISYATGNIQVVDPAGTGGSIALDSNDNPHISYYVNEFFKRNNTGLNYAVWTGTNWSTQNVDQSGFGGSLALDSYGNPQISYTGRNGLMYASWNGTKWNIQTVDSSGDSGSSLALDSSNQPHISYYTGDFLKYAKLNGTIWAVQTVDSRNKAGLFKTNSIAVDSNNNPHIVYGETTGNVVKCATWTGTNWLIQTVFEGTAEIGNIVIDSKGLPHIAYIQSIITSSNPDTGVFTQKDSLAYAYWNGLTWNIQIVDSKPYNVEYEQPYITLDSSDNPQILFYKKEYPENVDDAGLMYAKWTGSSWSTRKIGSDGFDDVALDSHGTFHTVSTHPVGTYHGALTYGNLTYATLETPPYSAPPSLPITIIAVTGAIIGIGLLFYFKKRKR